MKMKKLICLILGTIISSHCFAAWQFQGEGRVVDEHQGTSGGALGGGLIDRDNTLKTPTSPLSASASAVAYSNSGYINKPFNAFAGHSVYIKNNTPVKQRYSYYYELCADSTRCFNYNTTIELNSGSTASNQATSYVTVQFSQAGTYYSHAITRIAGEQTGISGDTGFLTVMRN